MVADVILPALALLKRTGLYGNSERLENPYWNKMIELVPGGKPLRRVGCY